MAEPAVDGVAEAFWRFSLDLYGRPGAAPACLALQDGHGRDVNLVLYACWLAASGRGPLTQGMLRAAETALAPWRRGVIEPLRQARRAAKGEAEAAELYARLKAVELAAEKIAHRRLAALAPLPGAGDPEQRLAAAASGLALYLGAAFAVAEPILAALRGVVRDQAS